MPDQAVHRRTHLRQTSTRVLVLMVKANHTNAGPPFLKRYFLAISKHLGGNFSLSGWPSRSFRRNPAGSVSRSRLITNSITASLTSAGVSRNPHIAETVIGTPEYQPGHAQL